MKLPWGLNVRHVYLAFFSLISIALCGFSMAIYSQYVGEQAFNDYTFYQYDAIRQSRQIQLDILDMENSMRGYVISGDARFLDPYNRAAAHLQDDILTLRQSTYYEPNALAESTRWLNAAQDLQALMDGEIATIKARGEGSIPAAELDRQKTKIDALRNMLDDGVTRRAAAVGSRRHVAQTQQRAFLYLLIFGTALGVAIVLAGTLVIIKLEDANDRTEDERQRAESRFQTVLNGVNDGLYELNFVNDTMYMSPEFKGMLGFGEDEMDSTVQAVLDLIHPDDLEGMLETRRRYVLKHTPAYHNIFRMKHKDGTWRWILSRGVGTWDKFGNIRNILGTHTDITDQKMREEELRQLHTDMEAFTYITSHDMRSPLVNLRGFSHELRMGVGEVAALLAPEKDRLDPATWAKIEAVLGEDIPEALGFIGNAVDRMDTLTTAILDLSRIGKYTYRDEPVSSQAIFDKCLGAQSYEISNKGVEVAVEPLPELVTDPLALEQVFSNLLDNAVKYLKPGEPGRIEVGCRETVRDYVFSIRDNGRGIDPEDSDRVFNIFRRARNTGDVRGLGLGMAFVKATLRKLSGAIWFESVVGGGTTFYVSLPKKAPAGAGESVTP